MYAAWKGSAVPVECLVNIELLRKHHRRVVQIDMTYYSCMTQNVVRSFLDQLNDVVVYKDVYGNFILHLASTPLTCDVLQQNILQHLDPIFYKCAAAFPEVFEHENIARVSLNVVQDEYRCGALLVMMCRLDEVKWDELHAHFRTVAGWVADVDSTLQLTLTTHYTPGLWKNCNEFVPERHRRLPRVPRPSIRSYPPAGPRSPPAS